MATYRGEEIDLTPTSGMKDEADRALAWKEEGSDGGTLVGLARARQLSSREELSASTVRRMFSFFSRHEVDKQGEGFNPGEEGYPSAGRVAWGLWGGDPGQSWSRRKVEELNKIDERKDEQERSAVIEKDDELLRAISDGGPVWRAAESKPNLIDESSLRAELVWTSGAAVRRSGVFGDWNESLDLRDGSVRMDRLQSGTVPLLKNHDASSIDNVIGVVERAWIKGGEGRAVVRFSDRPEVAGIFQDVKNGILRSISVGYRVHSFQEVTKEGEEVRSFMATDWEPLELSVVPIPADQAAGFRADEITELTNAQEEEGEMDTEQKKPEPTVELGNVKEEAIQVERARAAGILDACRKAKLEESFAQSLIETGVTLDQARAQVIEKVAEQANKTQIQNNVRIEVVSDARDHLIAGAEQALLHRYNASKYGKLDERAHQFVGRNLLEMGRIFVESKGYKTTGLNVGHLAERALHSTSDFPLLLSNVAGKVLRDAYAEAPQTWRPLVREVELSNFKEVTRLQLGDAPSLEEINESGEVKRGTIGEAKEAYKLAEYAKAVGVTRRTLIDDDLGAFTRLPALFARAAADLESDTVYSIFGQNPVMGDGTTLFHADHGNTGAAGDPSIATLSEARQKMRLQKGLGGRLINVQATYALCPASLETKFQQILAATQPNQNSQVNPFAGSLQLIVEPRLDGYGSAWYLVASPGQIDTIEVAYLMGERGPQISTREGWDVQGFEIKCHMAFAAKAIDHRGMFKNG